MSKYQKLTETQKLVLRASYDKYYVTFGSKQKALEKVAEEFGIHWQTARTMIAQTRGADKAIIADVKSHQASKIDKIINSILDDLEGSGRMLKGMSAAQSVLAVSQLIDKVAKLRGDDIQKIEVHEVGERLEKKLVELQNLRAALENSLKLPKNTEKVEEN